MPLFGSTVIQGGTLNNNGGTLGTTNASFAFLDGSTVAGAVTINGTYTGGSDTDTELRGTITNQGNIQLNGGGGFNTLLLADSTNVTLQGGGTRDALHRGWRRQCQNRAAGGRFHTDQRQQHHPGGGQSSAITA